MTGDAQDPKPDQSKNKDGQYMGAGIAIGLVLGTALSVAMDNVAFIGAGIALGVAIGTSLDEHQKKKKQ